MNDLRELMVELPPATVALWAAAGLVWVVSAFLLGRCYQRAKARRAAAALGVGDLNETYVRGFCDGIDEERARREAQIRQLNHIVSGRWS